MDLRSLLLPALDGTDARTVLLAHPAVAAVSLAPAPGGVTRAVVTPAAAGHRPGLRLWKRTFDLVYHSNGSPYAGWRSSVDGQPYPAGHMTEWVDSAVALATESPFRTVLEIGAGTGLLARRLAPLSDRYICTDASSASRDMLRVAAAQNPSFPLEVSDCPTDGIGGLPLEPDLVVLNSVVQYFPDLGYLFSVVRQTLDLLRPGGRLLLGDVRGLEVAPAHFVLCHESSGDAGNAEATVAGIVGTALASEHELLVDSAFFHALPALLPAAASVEVRHRRARRWNEMAAFRFDVVVHKREVADGPVDASASIQPLRDPEGLGDVDGCALLRGVPNSRLNRPLALLRRRLVAERGACRLPGDTAAAWHPDRLQEHLRRSRPGTRVRWSDVPGALDALACAHPGTSPLRTP